MHNRLCEIMDAYGLRLRLVHEDTLFFTGESVRAMAEIKPGRLYFWIENFSNWRSTEFTGEYRRGLFMIPSMAEEIGAKPQTGE